MGYSYPHLTRGMKVRGMAPGKTTSVPTTARATTAGTRSRSAVVSVTPCDSHTLLVIGHSEQRQRVLSVPVAADLGLARRFAATVRKVVSVEIDLGEPAVGRVQLVGHRLPVTRRVPLSLALGLGALGVRTTVEEH